VTDKDYIRAFKNDTGKLYTSKYTGDPLETTTDKSTQECKNRCDSNTSCVWWSSKLTGTKNCELYGKAGSPALYAEGAVGL
jgi:hypothetical protein